MNTDAARERKVLDDNIAHAIKECARSIGIAVVQGRSTCLHCAYFNDNTEACALAGGQRPPARVIAFGCTSFSPVIPGF
jgi:hypothetical protein